MWAMQAQTLTAEQCRELLRVAKDRMVQVKVHDKGVRSTPGRARLIGVCDNDRQAIVKPHHHGKNETVELSQISYWVGGNSHFPEGAKIVQQSFLASGLSNAAGGLTAVNNPHYVVSDSLKKVWGGSVNKWVSIPRNAHEFPNHADASRSIYRLKMQPESNDARVVSKADMQKLVGGWMSEKSPATQFSTNTVPKIEEIAPPVESQISTIERRPAPLMPSLPTPNYGVSEFDFDQIAKEDGNTLQKAFAERQKAAQDAVEARSLLEDAISRIRSSTAIIQAHIGQVSTPQQADKKNSGQPRGTVRAAIRKILSESSRLDTTSLVQKVQGLGIDSSSGSIKQAIYSMRQAGLIESGEHGHSLTAKGRE